MAKFNVVQKRRRAAVADRKRMVHGDPITGKLHQKPQPHSVSGKRQQKLLKKWRREQKEAVEKGLITMEDVEMAAAADEAQDASKAPGCAPAAVNKFPMGKKSTRTRLGVKQLKKKGKGKKTTREPTGGGDAMVE
ncbi:uncharacterized protein LOC127256221 [Andrographis paniculata]|uniref:uncharacterized protein LOC127256221 n=1 Tax=Andrographis paniculata TaxID=175694 RepID=UPI0021E9419E|nr:uncharacterized protein LOC127256221 [Andrographis paniculata]